MRVVGLLVDWISTTYHQKVWEGIQAFFEQEGVNLMTLVIGRAGSSLSWEQMRGQLLDFVDGKHFDGFIFLPATLGSHRDNYYALLDKVAPAPVISVADELPDVHSILVNNASGFQHLLQHLFDSHGYRRFAYAGGPADNRDSLERKEVFLNFVQKNSLTAEPEHVLDGAFTTMWGNSAIAALIPGDEPEFDVLVCANDDICIGAINALARKGLRVPQDLAITGFDDTDRAASASLSTVRQPLQSLGWMAASHLMSVMDGIEVSALTRIGSEAVIRMSCGCPSPEQHIARLPRRGPKGHSILELLEKEGALLLKEMLREGIDKQLALGLIENFQESIQVNDSSLLLKHLRRVADALGKNSQQIHQLNSLLNVLRRWCEDAKDVASVQTFVNSALGQAHLLINAELHEQNIRDDSRQTVTKDVMLDLNARLIYAKHFPDQMAVMLALLPDLEIRDFQIVLYDDTEHPMQGAHVVLTHEGEQSTDCAAYNPRTLLSPIDTEVTEPWCHVVGALYDQKLSLGFFRFQYQGDVGVLSCFDPLCEVIGRGIGTVRRIQDLEYQVTRRTEQLQSALADLEQRNKTLNAVAVSDQLTGLYNRRGFLSLAEEHFQLHSQPHPVTLFFADLDGLKWINDNLGHEVGDSAIRTAARLLTKTFRAEDIIARLGGDEFVVLAPGCTPSVAKTLATRLTKNFAETESGRYHISMGWVAIDMAAHLPLNHWMKEADEALYVQKKRKKAISTGAKN